MGCAGSVHIADNSNPPTVRVPPNSLPNHKLNMMDTIRVEECESEGEEDGRLREQHKKVQVVGC